MWHGRFHALLGNGTKVALTVTMYAAEPQIRRRKLLEMPSPLQLTAKELVSTGFLQRGNQSMAFCLEFR
jgi:hypothetical protein